MVNNFFCQRSLINTPLPHVSTFPSSCPISIIYDYLEDLESKSQDHESYGQTVRVRWTRSVYFLKNSMKHFNPT